MFGKAEELIVILLIILLLFGNKKIPQLARSIGESVKEIKKGFNGEVSEEKKPTENKTKKVAVKTKSSKSKN